MTKKDTGAQTTCGCGCGGKTNRVVRGLLKQDRGTAEQLHWAELSIAPMRVEIFCIGGHEKDLPDVVSPEGDHHEH